MSIPLLCLLGGVVLPYIWAGVSVPFRNKQLGGVDLAQPRLQAALLTEGGAGAWGAQMNQWEALAVFTAAHVAAFIQGLPVDGVWTSASLVWLAARILHGLFYVVGQAPLRVMAFVVSLLCSVWIFVAALLV